MTPQHVRAALALAWAAMLAACTPTPKNGPATYTEAVGYAYHGQNVHSPQANHGQLPRGGNLLSRPVIQSQKELDFLFGPEPGGAAPTDIDFERQFAIAVVLPPTTVETEIIPGSLYAAPDELILNYSVRHGAELATPVQPCKVIVVSREFARDVARTERTE